MVGLLVISLILMMNWRVLATKLLTVQNILWAFSCPGLLSLRVEIPLFFLGLRVSPLSGRVCLLPRALLTCASNTSERWALLGQRSGTPRRGAYGFERRATGAGSRGGTGVGSPLGFGPICRRFWRIISFPFTHERCRRLQGGGPTRAWQHSGNTRRDL